MPSFFINSLSIGSLLLHSSNYLFSITVDYALLFHQFPLDRLTPPPLLQLPSCTNSLIMATSPRQSTPRYRRHTGIPLPQLPACHQRPQPPHRCHLRHRCDSGEGLRKRPPELINTLWPEGTTARSDLEGLTALRTQLPEALRELPELVKTSREQQRSTTKSSVPKSVDFNSLPKPEEIKEELKNALRSTPKGLEAPKYSVVRVIKGELKLGVPEKIQIRKYEAFTVATTPSMGGTGFNTLASYLFGGNEEKKAMAMTMPVFVTGKAG